MILWIVVAILGIGIDLMTSAFLFSFFSVGSLGALILEAFGVGFGIQVIVFFIVSILLIIFCYPIVKKKLRQSTKRVKTMEEEYIGKKFIAYEDIEKEGRIKVGGVYWAGINEGEKILKNEEFTVIGIEGSKLKIKKEESKNE
ncbi:NfeD family protein [uncultured Clostridium sp.]|uniref:NfeD family protein n=1 Tax=uncultured Clostridium sp. TaxID=59620 RepID=UPI00260C9D59|nr:NfeD family protein [uncultured Clostridium sp.]